MTLKNEDLVNNQKKLAEQMKIFSQQQAQASYNKGQRSLQEQLRQQRMNMQQSRGQLAEQSYLANRTIQQGAQSRGLGSSGIKDLSVLQSQLAQGRATSDLEKENTNVQRAAIDAKLGLDESLRTSLTGAELQSQEANINADRYAMDLQQKDRDLMLQLMDMAGAGASPETIKAYADILGLDMNSQMGEGGTLKDRLDALTPNFDELDETDYSSIVGNGQALDAGIDIARWLDPTKYINWALQNAFKINLGHDGQLDKTKLSDTMGLYESGWNIASGNKYGYQIGNERFVGTPQQARQKVNAQYEGKQYFGKEITTKVTQNGAVRFVFNGKEFNTYAQAKNAVQAKLNQE